MFKLIECSDLLDIYLSLYNPVYEWSDIESRLFWFGHEILAQVLYTLAIESK